MEELFELLRTHNDVVTMELLCPGCTMSHNFTIVATQDYADGLELFTDGEGKIFISSLISRVIQKTIDEDEASYTIQTSNGALVTFTMSFDV